MSSNAEGQLAGLESLGLNIESERDAEIIDYIRALETEVIKLTRELSAGLADMRREQSAIELAGRRIEAKHEALVKLVLAEPVDPILNDPVSGHYAAQHYNRCADEWACRARPAQPPTKKRIILHRTRIVPRLKIVKATSL